MEWSLRLHQCPVGRPPNEVRRFHANFTYQAGSWTKPRRVIAKVEWHPGELYPRVGFIVTNLSRPRFDFERFDAKFGDINTVLSDVATASGVVLIDPVRQLCPQRECPVFDGVGNPRYRDGSHFTRNYAIDAATYIGQTLRP